MKNKLVLMLTLVFLFAGIATTWADILIVDEYQITSSSATETTPTIGNDGTTDLVVYTVQPLVGILTEGDVFLCYDYSFLKLGIRPFFGCSLRGLPRTAGAEPVSIFIVELNVIDEPVVFRGGASVEVKRFVCHNEETLPFFC
jgi:hypothetical protein